MSMAMDRHFEPVLVDPDDDPGSPPTNGEAMAFWGVAVGGCCLWLGAMAWMFL